MQIQAIKENMERKFDVKKTEGRGPQWNFTIRRSVVHRNEIKVQLGSQVTSGRKGEPGFSHRSKWHPPIPAGHPEILLFWTVLLRIRK